MTLLCYVNHQPSTELISRCKIEILHLWSNNFIPHFPWLLAIKFFKKLLTPCFMCLNAQYTSYKGIIDLSFCELFILLSIMSSSLSHLTAFWETIFFYKVAYLIFIVCTSHFVYPFICQWASNLNIFCWLSILLKLWAWKQICLLPPFNSFDYILRSEIAVSHGNSTLNLFLYR